MFADDERDANPTTFKFFQAAQNWAAQRASATAGLYEPDDSDDSDEEVDGDNASDGQNKEETADKAEEDTNGGPMDEDA